MEYYIQEKTKNMTKDDLINYKTEVQSILKRGEEIENLIKESLNLRESEQDWVFEFLYNSEDQDEYAKMVEKHVDEIFLLRKDS